MPFSLGATELLFLVVLAIPVALLFTLGHRHYRDGIAAFVCAVLAALSTPADIISMVLMFLAFAGVFWFGSRYRLDPPSTDSIMNRQKITLNKTAFSIVALSVCMLVVGVYYTAAGSENPLAYHAFRAWAFTTASIAMFAIGCTIYIANFAWRRTRSTSKFSA